MIAYFKNIQLRLSRKFLSGYRALKPVKIIHRYVLKRKQQYIKEYINIYQKYNIYVLTNLTLYCRLNINIIKTNQISNID